MSTSQPNSALPTLRIGEVSKATKLSPSTIRWYEKLGLVLPQREPSGYRTYSQDDVMWLLTLRAYFAATHDSPRCLAQLLAWLPMRELHRIFAGTVCACKPNGGVCWSVGATPAQSRICRSCPAYQHKDVALDPRRFFEARLRSTSADGRATAMPHG